jgi:hypothetical protein
MATKFNFKPSPESCHCSQYTIWKNIAECLDLPKTYIVGVYEYEFCRDMWNDVGFDEIKNL